MATRDSLYEFQPTATDANGDRLTFSIVNKPKWMWFSSRTGRLRGHPKWAQRDRTFPGIVIQVSDGQSTRALAPFAITVTSQSLGANRAPEISGSPATVAQVGRTYAFKPTASDPDGDRLSFAVSGKPAWATFDTVTGVLSGIPRAADVGTQRKIVIRVSDGKLNDAMAPFAIAVTSGSTASVTLSWSAPTQNTDGSALTDLAGYKIFYGSKPRQYSTSVRLPMASNSAVIDGLTAGPWYFAIKSINGSGVESNYSGEVKAVL